MTGRRTVTVDAEELGALRRLETWRRTNGQCPDDEETILADLDSIRARQSGRCGYYGCILKRGHDGCHDTGS